MKLKITIAVRQSSRAHIGLQYPQLVVAAKAAKYNIASE